MSQEFIDSDYNKYDYRIDHTTVKDEFTFMKFLINLRNSKRQNKMIWSSNTVEDFLDSTIRGNEDRLQTDGTRNPWSRMAEMLEIGAVYE